MCDHLAHYCWRLDIPHTQKMILVRCAMYASPNGSDIRPGLDRMASELGFSRSTIGKVFKEFTENGVLIVEHSTKGGRGQATVYGLDIDRVEDLYPPHEFAERPRYRSVENRHAETATQEGPKGKPSASRTVSADGENRPSEGINRPPDDAKPSASRTPIWNNIDNLGEAAENGAPEGAGPTAASPQKDAAVGPLSAHWKACEAKIIATIGRADWAALFKIAVCEFDDSETMILSLPTRALANIARQKYGDALAGILERKLEIIILAHVDRAAWLEERRNHASA